MFDATRSPFGSGHQWAVVDVCALFDEAAVLDRCEQRSGQRDLAAVVLEVGHLELARERSAVAL